LIAVPDDPSVAAAGDALTLQVLERGNAEMREWLFTRRGYSTEWQEVSFLNDTITYLTPAEIAALSGEVVEVFLRHTHRVDRSNRPEGAIPVRLMSYAHPVPPTAAGN
jgi:hypothetical protein